MKSFERKYGDLTLQIDYRTELLGIIELISKYKDKYPQLLSEQGNKKYRDRIINLFSSFSNHEIIKLFNKFVEQYNFSYDAPIALFLSLNEEWAYNKPDDYIYKIRLREDNDLFRFVEKLSDFVKEIDFEKYYLQNEAFYEECFADVEAFFKEEKITNFINNYLGKSDNNFIVNLLPFSTRGNYGTAIGNEVYANIGLRLQNANKPTFINKNNEAYFATLLVHEFAHSYINPLTAKQHIIPSNSTLFDDVNDIMQKQAYVGIECILNETIIRAIEIQFADINYTKEDVNNCSKYNIENGFNYINVVIESLKRYERKRDVYKTIADFYPEILIDIQKAHVESNTTKVL